MEFNMNMNMNIPILLRCHSAVLPLVALVMGTCPLAAQADPVRDWNARAGEVAVAACISPAPNPFHESRLYAMVHIAIHDALNAIDRRSRPYAFDGTAAAGASVEAAAAAAARDVMVSELARIPFPFDGCASTSGIDAAEESYVDALGAIDDGPAKDDGIAIGREAAAAIIERRAFDNSEGTFLEFTYPEGEKPGEYRLMGYGFAAAPEWGRVTPFALQHAAQFRPPPPYSVSCAKPSPDRHAGQCRKYAEDLAEVQALGGDDVTGNTRTPDQTQIAFFWIESSPLAWNRLARDVAADAGLDAWQSARLFGLLNMGLADGYIASLDTKYHYNYWRPVSAIREAAADGNPLTEADELWNPADPTPPIPDYDSAHAVEGAVAAEVLRQFFGTDQWSFEVCSLTLPVEDQRCGGVAEVRRSFERFSEAANENGESRILIGYHFRKAVEAGLEHGKKIGAATVRGHLKPLR
jgi:hypothetical protein